MAGPGLPAGVQTGGRGPVRPITRAFRQRPAPWPDALTVTNQATTEEACRPSSGIARYRQG